MNGWFIVDLVVTGSLVLVAAISYAAERDLRRRQERFRESMELLRRRGQDR